MDEGLNKAVNKVFVQLYREKLIYKDKRLVNWDPKMHTALSDLEVEQVEIKGNMHYFRYPVEGHVERFITIATTRPETMLGDTAIAVHPDDVRYALEAIAEISAVGAGLSHAVGLECREPAAQDRARPTQPVRVAIRSAPGRTAPRAPCTPPVELEQMTMAARV